MRGAVEAGKAVEGRRQELSEKGWELGEEPELQGFWCILHTECE